MALLTYSLLCGAVSIGTWFLGAVFLIVLAFAVSSAASKKAGAKARQDFADALAAGQPVTIDMQCDVGRRKMRFREGDEVSLWARPDSSLVYAFLLGTVGGDGKVGWASDLGLHQMVEGGRKHCATIVDAGMAREGVVRVRIVVDGVG